MFSLYYWLRRWGFGIVFFFIFSVLIICCFFLIMFVKFLNILRDFFFVVFFSLMFRFCVLRWFFFVFFMIWFLVRFCWIFLLWFCDVDLILVIFFFILLIFCFYLCKDCLCIVWKLFMGIIDGRMYDLYLFLRMIYY